MGTEVARERNLESTNRKNFIIFIKVCTRRIFLSCSYFVRYILVSVHEKKNITKCVRPTMICRVMKYLKIKKKKEKKRNMASCSA